MGFSFFAKGGDALASKKTPSKESVVCAYCDDDFREQHLARKDVSAIWRENFYKSRSELYRKNDGFIPVCKECVKRLFDAYTETLNDKSEAFYYLCARFDWYFNERLLSEIDERDPLFISSYLKRCNLAPNSFKTFIDTLKEGVKEVQDEKNAKLDAPPESTKKENIYLPLTDEEITSEMIAKWGSNFEPYEYIKLENLYSDMVMVNPRMEETPQDKDYLRKICFNSVMLERAYIEGDEAKIRALSGSYSKFMQDSKLRAMDKTEADKSGGLRNFSQIYAEVESDDFIPPWAKIAKMKGVNQDIVDRSIMHIENHTRRFRKEEMYVAPPEDTPKLSAEEIDPNARIFRDCIDLDGDVDG